MLHVSCCTFVLLQYRLWGWLGFQCNQRWYVQWFAQPGCLSPLRTSQSVKMIEGWERSSKQAHSRSVLLHIDGMLGLGPKGQHAKQYLLLIAETLSTLNGFGFLETIFSLHVCSPILPGSRGFWLLVPRQEPGLLSASSKELGVGNVPVLQDCKHEAAPSRRQCCSVIG